MKTTLFNYLLAVTLSIFVFTSCSEKESVTPVITESVNPQTGEIIFRASDKLSCSSINIGCGGTSRILNKRTDNTGNAIFDYTSFNLETGTHMFKATANDGHTWSGSIYLSADRPVKVWLLVSGTRIETAGCISCTAKNAKP